MSERSYPHVAHLFITEGKRPGETCFVHEFAYETHWPPLPPVGESRALYLRAGRHTDDVLGDRFSSNGNFGHGAIGVPEMCCYSTAFKEWPAEPDFQLKSVRYYPVPEERKEVLFAIVRWKFIHPPEKYFTDGRFDPEHPQLLEFAKRFNHMVEETLSCARLGIDLRVLYKGLPLLHASHDPHKPPPKRPRKRKRKS